jgi:hypothetical protein
MLRKITAMLCTALLALSISIPIQAADSPQISEGFGCDFIDGKDSDDLDKVIEYYTSQRSKIDSPALQKMRSVTWTPILGSVNVDLVWFNGNLTFNEWGEVQDALSGTSVGQAITDRFNTVLDCPGSGLSITENLFRSDKEFTAGDGVVIESYRCNLSPGKTIADTDAAIAAWKPVFANAVAATDTASIVGRRTPLISGSGFDLTYYLVWDDASAYAAGNSARLADPEDATSAEMFAAAHTCESALFNGRIVVRPSE